MPDDSSMCEWRISLRFVNFGEHSLNLPGAQVPISRAMVLKGFLYNTVFRRNSTYAAFIVAGAVLGENFLNDVVDSRWQESNKGVR